ncbi:MAG: hypothetical protein ACOY32_14650 [Thermodesulfobacteriota bacterium]
MKTPLYPIRSLLLSLAALVLIVVVAGCQSGGGASGTGTLLRMEERKGDGRLSVFLAVKGEGPSLWMKIHSVEVLSGGTWYPLTPAREELTSDEIRANGQILLARGGLPGGTYQALRFSMDKAAVARDGKQIFLAINTPVLAVDFPGDLTLARDDSTSLFLTWDTENSLESTALFTPQLDAGMQRIPIVNDLAYVTCPDLDTIYIIRTDTNAVCGSIGVTGAPGSIVADVERNRIYVLAVRQSAIKVLELTSNLQIDLLRLPLTVKPTYMTVAPDGKTAYLLDETGNNLLSVNLQSGMITAQMRLGSRPKYLLFAETLNQLVVSSSFGQKVFFLDPTTLATVRTIDTGGSPDGLLVENNTLYVAESSSNAVSIFELPSGRSKGRLTVGSKPRRFVANNNQVYVANFGGGSLSILRPGQISVARDIRVGGNPFEMDSVQARQWLYVNDSASGSILVVDLSTNRVVKRIELGTVPEDLAVVN